MNNRSVKHYIYIAFALIMLMVSWESNQASAALIKPSIPEESIRIRVLANSDRVEDQWIKKEIREAIVGYVNSWNLDFQGIEEARREVQQRLPEISATIGAVLDKYNFTYGHQVELGKVEFPAKVFGQETYPSGEYEALRVTLGEGKGENWWCVLFPPLCFGSAVKATAAEPEPKTEPNHGTSHSNQQVNAGSVYQAPVQDGDDVEIQFFLAVLLQKLVSILQSLFA